MANESRSVIEGRQPQGVNEAIRWVIVVKPAAVTAGPVTVHDVTNEPWQDVTLASVTGAASVQDGKVVLPLVHGLTAGHVYRVAVQYSDGTSTLEPYIEIEAER